MVDLVIVKGDDGRLTGLGQKNAQRYAKWQSKVRDLEVGETVEFSWKQPRSGPFHRLHFALLNAVFDSQEQFHEFEQFRMWCQVGAGHAEFVPGPKGKPVAIPKSIAYASLDDIEFKEHHEKVVEFLRSEHCTRFLWPHLPAEQASETVEQLLAGFDG